MTRNSEAVKRWRRSSKARIIAALGGKCVVCDYHKCPDALECHHLDPSEKDFSLGSVRANATSWAKIVVELRKCVLLCSNCHREVHANLTQVPEKSARFDEKFVDYKEKQRQERFEPCPICDKAKPSWLITCSRACAAKKSRKVDWDSINLVELKKTMNNCEIADLLGVSNVAVRKRYLKILHSSSSGRTP